MNETDPPAVVDPDFAASIAAGLVETYEDYCKRTTPPDEEAAS
ncbi:hypothetical protein [Streptomyces nigrescens]